MPLTDAPPVSLPPTRVVPRSPLLPDSLKQPLMLLWVAVLPQLVLLGLNLRAFTLVAGEFAPWQHTMSLCIFGCELALLLGAAAIAVTLRLRREEISWALCWPLLVASCLYLWLVTAQVGGSLIPGSVSVWILPPDQLLYYQFALVMPLVFYAGVRLSCAELPLSLPREIGVLAGILVGVPLCAYLLALTESSFHFFGHYSEVLIVIAVVGATFLVLGAVARACVSGYVATRRKGPIGLSVLSFMIGIAGPLGGLWLNAYIPFPADLQSWPVYAMALANGCILLLPNFRHPQLHRAVWLAQCALFPFTLYFFLLILPFLPLSIVAMIIAGAGFLILVPTALFLVHGERILDGYRNEIRDGSRLTPALLGALALAVLPIFLATQAVVDRVVLRGAIDYIYSPDYRHAERFQESPGAVRRSLERLRDFKAGLQLPFLSGFYNWVVFDNLVLPDEKMHAIHRAFFGHDLAPANSDRINLLGGGRRGFMQESTRPIPLPPSDVTLAPITNATVREGDCARTTFTLDMRNQSDRQSEFVAQIKLPEGVFVSGFWLKIGEERVPGRLFEKKTALWVYQMIRDRSRRDPGILVYTDPQSIELRVFPFAAHEERRVEIEFLYPAALHPALTIGEQSWRGEGTGPAISLTQTGEGTSAVALTAEAIAQLPRAPRAPYLHFIVDRSAESKFSDEALVRAMHQAAAQLGGATECAITFANYECADLSKEPVPLASITAATLRATPALETRGGFLAERATKRALLAYQDQLSQAAPGSPWLQRFPVIVLLSDAGREHSFSSDLVHFAPLAPDSTEFYVTADGATLRAYDFRGQAKTTAPAAFTPVALLKVGDAVSACALDRREPALVQFAATKDERTLSVLRDGSFDPLTPTAMIPTDAPYSRGVEAWQRYFALMHNPSLGNRGLADVVELSRESGVLVTATSYIVVENTAQWKMLELKQRQKLRNQSALEFEQVPEPTTALLLGSGAVWLLSVRRRRTSRAS